MFKSFQKKTKMEIVIARYNENVMWLQGLLERTSDYDDVKITIYNKGNTPVVIDAYNDMSPKMLELQRDRVKVIQLPNVGVCDHTYLHHIVSRYDSLKSTTLFLPASSYDDESKRPRLLVLMQSMLLALKTNPVPETTSVISIPWMLKSVYVSFSRNKQVDAYTCTDSRNRDGSQAIRPAAIRPFGKWYDAHLKQDIGECKNVTLKGMFMVGKSKFLARPLEMFVKLRDMVSNHRFPEEAHYVERSWHAIINPNSSEEISLLLVVPYMKEIIAIILLLVALIVIVILSHAKKPVIKFASKTFTPPQ